jgi:hypothetical protein
MGRRHRDGNMTEAVKALNPPAQEAPSDAPGSPETASDAGEGATPRPGTPGQQAGAQRPWWRRVFGG